MNNRTPGILIVDNYDSFTYNLVQIIQELGGCHFDVMKNDTISIASASKYDGFLFSPGPGVPDEVPLMGKLLKAYQGRKSFLGICLGHQVIAETYGMKLVRLNNVRHGLKRNIRVVDPPDYIFKDLPSEFDAGLYHSWAAIIEPEIMQPASDLRVTALSDDGIIMAIAHTRYDIRGIQFHPESYLSEYGHKIIQNWISNMPVREK